MRYILVNEMQDRVLRQVDAETADSAMRRLSPNYGRGEAVYLRVVGQPAPMDADDEDTTKENVG